VDNVVPIVNQLPVRPPSPSPKVKPLTPPTNTVNQGNAPKKITAKVQVVKKETGRVKVGDGTKTVLNEPKLDENTAQKNKAMVGELQTKLKRKPSVREMAPGLDHSHDQGQGNQLGKKVGTGGPK
jgi:hypothetical protein